MKAYIFFAEDLGFFFTVMLFLFASCFGDFSYNIVVHLLAKIIFLFHVPSTFRASIKDPPPAPAPRAPLTQ